MKTKLKRLIIQKEEISDIEWLQMEKAFDLIRQGKTKFLYDKRYEKIFEQVREHYQEKNKQDREKQKVRKNGNNFIWNYRSRKIIF